MVTVWPSNFPMSAIVTMGGDMNFQFLDFRLPMCKAHRARLSIGNRRWKMATSSAFFQLAKRLAHEIRHVDLFVPFNFQDQWRSVRRRAQQFHSFFPRNFSLAGPQMRVPVPGVVVNVGGTDVTLENLIRLRNIDRKSV